MELTISQALEKAVEAHQAGRIQEAERLYLAIRKAQPKHPDANHNLGVLAVSVGKVSEALPFLKTALEVNPSIAQFWLSFIGALIKLDRNADAKSVLDQAKSKGAKGDGFDKLEKLLNGESKGNFPDVTLIETCNIDENTKLNLGIKLRDNGEFDQAIKLLTSENRSTQNVDLLALLSHCYLLVNQIEEAKLILNKARELDPYNAAVGWNTVRLILKEQRPLEALALARDVSKNFPDDVEGLGVLGACLKASGEVVESLEVLNSAIELNPNYAEALISRGLIRLSQENRREALADIELAHNLKPHIKQIWDLVVALKVEAQEYADTIPLLINMIEIDPGNEKRLATLALCYQHLKEFDSAIEAYRKALAIKPGYVEAIINLGSALKEQDKLEEAMEAYDKALAIKPDYAEAYNNIGNALKDQGKLEKAMEAYDKALAIKPDYPEAVENVRSLAVQLLPIIANYGSNFDSNAAKETSGIFLRPRYHIQNAIEAYLEGNFVQADTHNKSYKACDQRLLDSLTPARKVFCAAYSSFIGKLLDARWDEEPASGDQVYHLGESHCLSYAHRNITIDGSNYRIAPRITFGAKAFHFSQPKYNIFKAITKAHFTSLPNGSIVFASYGEIDCRPREGFISATDKLNKPLEELIDHTTRGYVEWFLEQNKDKGHHLYFLNVPAPVYDEKLTTELNSELTKTVALFNTALKKYSLQHGFEIVDVFKFTAKNDGFSNCLFHVDRRHLGAKALGEIQRQLS